jgi:aspartyl-tRNA(Asn)/glutamyl-tRNA(Gln) amidotransferase subunit A
VAELTVEPWTLSLVEAAALIEAGDLKPSELVASALSRLEAVEPFIQAFVSVDVDQAIGDALAYDEQPGGPLRGIPVAVKDIFDVAGRPTGCGSAAMAGAAPASKDAATVARLRAAGSIILGKSTTHELACGVYTPPTRNPWDLERSPGGSSGGSGAAVAAGIVPGAIGSDTGGSIRIPAAHCGLVGLKPTYGRVSRAGALVLSWSLDHVGVLTRTVEDAAVLLAILAGPDPSDPTSLKRPPQPDPLLSPDDEVRGLRVGVLKGRPFSPMAPSVQSDLDGAVALLAAQGVELEEADLPQLESGLAAEFAIVAAESASYHETRLQDAGDLIGDDVRGLLETGLLLPASVYLRAQRTRRVIQQAFMSLFESQRLDALIAPTVPAVPQFRDQSEYQFDGTSEPVIDALVRTTAPFNLAGLPSIAVPTAVGPSGFPGSVQIVARPFDEQTALRLALAVERSSERTGRPRGLEIALTN